MHEIICPHCGKAFKIDEAGYANILKQVRDGDFEKQLHDRLELAEKDKAVPEVASIRGDIYLKLNKLDEAIAAYEQAQRFDAKVAEAYLLRSKHRQTKGQAEAAEADFRQAVALDPSLENARN